jgi:hypothetical protein
MHCAVQHQCNVVSEDAWDEKGHALEIPSCVRVRARVCVNQPNSIAS